MSIRTCFGFPLLLIGAALTLPAHANLHIETKPFETEVENDSTLTEDGTASKIDKRVALAVATHEACVERLEKWTVDDFVNSMPRNWQIWFKGMPEQYQRKKLAAEKKVLRTNWDECRDMLQRVCEQRDQTSAKATEAGVDATAFCLEQCGSDFGAMYIHALVLVGKASLEKEEL